MNPYKYKISLRLRHPSLNLAKISAELLKLAPTLKIGRISNFGEKRTTPAGKPLDGNYKASIAGFVFAEHTYGSKDKTLEDTVSEILDEFKPSKSLLNSFFKEDGRAELFVGLFIDENSGITLPPSLTEKLTDFKIELQLDIYPPDKRATKSFAPSDFESAVMEAILEESIPEKEILQQQWRQAKIAKRFFSGVGFFSTFEIPDDAPKTSRMDFEANSADITVVAKMPGLKTPMGFILFVRDGKMSTLEGYTFEDWPDTTEFTVEKTKLHHPQKKH